MAWPVFSIRNAVWGEEALNLAQAECPSLLTEGDSNRKLVASLFGPSAAITTLRWALIRPERQSPSRSPRNALLIGDAKILPKQRPIHVPEEQATAFRHICRPHSDRRFESASN